MAFSVGKSRCGLILLLLLHLSNTYAALSPRCGDSVTDLECNKDLSLTKLDTTNRWIYNAAAANVLCSSNPCEVGSTNALDQEKCCTNHATGSYTDGISDVTTGTAQPPSSDKVLISTQLEPTSSNVAHNPVAEALVPPVSLAAKKKKSAPAAECDPCALGVRPHALLFKILPKKRTVVTCDAACVDCGIVKAGDIFTVQAMTKPTAQSRKSSKSASPQMDVPLASAVNVIVGSKTIVVNTLCTDSPDSLRIGTRFLGMIEVVGFLGTNGVMYGNGCSQASIMDDATNAKQTQGGTLTVSPGLLAGAVAVAACVVVVFGIVVIKSFKTPTGACDKREGDCSDGIEPDVTIVQRPREQDLKRIITSL